MNHETELGRLVLHNLAHAEPPAETENTLTIALHANETALVYLALSYLVEHFPCLILNAHELAERMDELARAQGLYSEEDSA